MARRSVALLVACLAALFALPVLAQADTTSIIEPQHEPPTAADGWQAGTCISDEPVMCSPEHPELLYKQAGGHPPIGFTQYVIQHEETAGKVEPLGLTIPTSPIEAPLADRDIKTLRVDLPPGLTVNPQATPQCSLEDFEREIEVGPGTFIHEPNCPEGSVVGREEVTLVTTAPVVPAPSPPFPASQTLPTGTVIQPTEAYPYTKVPVYNIVPKPGEPALFGFVVAKEHVVFLETEVAWQSDFHEAFTIRLEESEPPFQTLKSRLVNFGQEAGNRGLVEEGNGTYLTTPTTCLDPSRWPHLYSTWFRAESYGEPNPTFPAGSTAVEAKAQDSSGNLIQQEGCDEVPFDPGVEVDPGTDAVDSPAKATVNTTLKYYTGDESEVEESHLRRAEETLPIGMGLNPAAAQGLEACTDAQFGKGVREYANDCPKESKIGTVEIETPPLPAGTLVGDVYLGEQKSRDPGSGEEFRVLVEAKSEERGVDVRLVGNVKADEKTGRLTAVFDEQEIGELAGELPRGLPQVPFTSVKLHFGERAVLTSPPTCAAAETTGQMEPWAREEQVPVSSKFTLSSDPNGGTCPQTLAQRKFAPGYSARTDGRKAGAYSPFHVRITRTDGQQELKAVDVTLPRGLTAKLKGIPDCGEAALAAAEKNAGKAEAAGPSCSEESRIGTATTRSGTGANPLQLAGKVYLAGPYQGAPLSMAIVTPAVAGPFDLGTVVVRVALGVNPETGQVEAVSDAIPDVFGGVKLDLRSIDLDLDRSGFMLNPTNCSSQATSGAIEGGGADPTDPAAWSTYAVSDPFQAVGCRKLGFRPKLKVRLFGSTKRARFPRLTAVLTARKGDANIARTALTLPHSLFLEQAHIGQVCTRPNLAANTCPKSSVYGVAEAKSPLLDRKLKGRVYMVPSQHELPDLVADLRGQVDIQLHGVISSRHGGLKTVFAKVPDLPVSRFVLKMKGGRKSLLVNSEDTCRKAQRAVLNIKGQNGKKVKDNRFELNLVSCKQHKHGRHHR